MELRFRPGRLLRVGRRGLCHRALRGRPYRTDQVPDRTPAGLGGTGARGSSDRDLRPAHAGPDVAACHRRHQRCRSGQRRRLPAQERSLPAAPGEYLDLMRRIWTSDSPFNHKGEFYRIDGAYLRHQAAPEALSFAVLWRLVRKVRWRWAPSIATCSRSSASRSPRRAMRVQDFRRRAAVFGRRVGFNMSLRPIMADTEGAAWDKAHALLADVERQTGAVPASHQPLPPNACSATRHAPTCMTSGCGWGSRAPPARPATRRVWSGHPSRSQPRCWNITGSASIPSCCAVSKIRHDTVAIGRDLIPLIKAGAIEIDRLAEAAE